MPTLEEGAKSRIEQGLRKFTDILTSAKQQNMNEADTSSIVHSILSDVLGYDRYFEATGEYKVRGQYADYAIKLDGSVKYFVEVKAAGVALNERHLRQVMMYAVNEGVEWAVLTNGHIWQMYHIAFEQPVRTELCSEVDILAGSRNETADLLYILSKRSVSRNELARYWEEKLALSAPNLLSALLSEPVIRAVRREFRRLTDHLLSTDEIRGLLKTRVLRPDVEPSKATKMSRRKRKA